MFEVPPDQQRGDGDGPGEQHDAVLFVETGLEAYLVALGGAERGRFPAGAARLRSPGPE